jgi:nucleotide-binding universal stress UspA family protein
MAIKDVLLTLTSYPDATPDASIERALSLCAALHAHVTALTFEAEFRIPATTSVLSNILLDVPLMLAEEKGRSEANAKRVLQTFDDTAARLHVPHARVLEKCVTFRVADAIVEHSHLHDLTVIPFQEGYSVEQWYAETAIFGSGRPTIVLPAEKTVRPLVLNTVVVAWDFTRSAARALGDALPILQLAKHVRLVTIAEEKKISEAHSPAELAQNLLRHGVGIELDIVDAKGLGAGDVLSAYCQQNEADFLVMGAYGHSRIREFVLGGATRSMLDKPPVPVIFSH